MAALHYFDGLEFDFFGVNKNCTLSTSAYPCFYGIQYIHSGSFYLAVDHEKRQILRGPAAFLTTPQYHYDYGSPAGSSRDHYYVCFSGERVTRFLSGGLFSVAPDRPCVRIARSEVFYADILNLILLLQNQDRHDLAVAKLEMLLLAMQNQPVGEKCADFHQKELERLARRIIACPDAKYDFCAEAAAMNISHKHLIRLFQRVHGLPPGRFVLRQRLLKAGELLIRRSDSIKTIAANCGFANEFYFSRVFKRYLNLAPEEYRNKHPYSEVGYPPKPELR